MNFVFLVFFAFVARDSTLAAEDAGAVVPPRPSHPYIVNLDRESIPVMKNGKVISYKSSYSGRVAIGSPREQEFRVIFDTGSGHIIVPAVQCEVEACLKHQRYDAKQSSTARPINADGTPVDASGVGDSVTIGFGTGKVSGELFEERVCFGPRHATATSSRSLRRRVDDHGPHTNATRPCSLVNTVMATEMSTNPFGSFRFDGVVGLGLSALSLSSNFSFFGSLMQSGVLEVSQFGFFVTGEAWEAGDAEGGELYIGGHDAATRAASPLAWAPVTKPEQGFWTVEIVSIHIGGVKLDFCDDGSCRGVVDSGTSHVGIPASFHGKVEQLLMRAYAGSSEDCRRDSGGAPTLEFGLRGVNLTLQPASYMRRLPLEKANGATVTKLCKPKTTPVRLPAPLGPNLFILGEPVMQSYYTVFDWSAIAPRIAFAAVRPRSVKEERDVPPPKPPVPPPLRPAVPKQAPSAVYWA
jgi:hypothetical protein